jgi:hypothetical protein
MGMGKYSMGGRAPANRNIERNSVKRFIFSHKNENTGQSGRGKFHQLPAEALIIHVRPTVP